QRLEREIGACEAEIARLGERLKDGAFLSKAPAEVVDKERGKLQACKDKLVRLRQELAQFG
ncbi:unnamed protein product, partial [marine sediment metagenome]